MKALQATCIVGAITFIGIHQVGANMPGVTVPDAMPEAAVSAETPSAPALCAAVPEASAGPEKELGSVPRPVSGPSLTAKAEIGNDSIETKSVGLGDCYFYPHHDAAQPVPTTHDASDEASNPAPVTIRLGASARFQLRSGAPQPMTWCKIQKDAAGLGFVRDRRRVQKD